MFGPLSVGALIVVIIISPFVAAYEHPFIAAPAGIVVGFGIFCLYVQGVQRRARRRFDAMVAADEHQKQLIREVIAEEKPHRFRNF